MRSFAQTIAELGARRGASSKEHLHHVLHKLGHPEKQFLSVHVAGTNGKGSVSTKIAKGLTLSGKKVGLFTSPHISSFCERIVIDGVQISEETVLYYIDQLHPFQLSFFETAFVMACAYFAKHSIDYAVIEAGIGGRFDTTNCLSSTHAVITSIGTDHKDLLGETVEEIAWQKAGILKAGQKVFLGPTASQFECMKSPEWETIPVEEATSFVEENIHLADRVLEDFQVPIDLRKRAVQSTLPCRFEAIGEWIFDIAHNKEAIEALLDQLPEKSSFFIGFSKGKDVRTCVELLQKRASNIVLLPTEKSERLYAQDYIERCLSSSIKVKNFEEAISLSHDMAPPYVVCGSAYIMEPMRSLVSTLK